MEKILKLGTHLELVPVGTKIDSEEAIEKRYTSSVHEILDDDIVVITNPTVQGRLIPLHRNERYDCYIFSNGKSYACRMVVDKSVLDGRIRVVHMRMASAIEKYERRRFFRLEVVLDLRYLMITAANSVDFKKAVLANNLLQMPGFKNGMTLDISGGGVKFIADEELPKDGMIIVHLEGIVGDKCKQYVFLGKVLGAERNDKKKGSFIYRVIFVDTNQSAREEFVRYIFEKERETLKKNANL